MYVCGCISLILMLIYWVQTLLLLGCSKLHCMVFTCLAVHLDNLSAHFTFFPRSLLYFTTTSCPLTVLLFLLCNCLNLYGQNPVMWKITSICYSSVVWLSDCQMPICTSYKIYPICDCNLANYNPVEVLISAQVLDTVNWIKHHWKIEVGHFKFHH